MRVARCSWVFGILAACSPAPAPAPDVAPPPAATAPAAAPVGVERVAPDAAVPVADPVVTSEAAPAAAPVAPGAPTAEDRAGAEAFGRSLQGVIAAGDVDAVRAQFDVAAITDALCAGLRLESRKLADFRTGLRTGMSNSIGVLANTWKDDDPTFRGVVTHDGRLAVRFRFVNDESGIGIVDFVLRPGPEGLRVADFHNRTLGFGMVEQTRQLMAPVLANLDRGFLERLVGGPGITKAHLDAFSAMAKAGAAGDFAAVVAAHEKLPAALRDTPAVISMHVAALQRTGDDAGYSAALKRAAAKFPAPLFRFMLVDVYFLEKDWDKAIACVDEFMAAVERDAAMLALRALLEKEAGRTDAALATLREALAAEPDCVYAHSKGLDVLLAAKDWAGVRASVEFLESTGRFAFKGQMEDPLWAGFLASPESAAWR